MKHIRHEPTHTFDIPEYTWREIMEKYVRNNHGTILGERVSIYVTSPRVGSLQQSIILKFKEKEINP